MTLTLLSGLANRPLADAVAVALGVGVGRAEIRRFPDGELGVVVNETVRGHDVYVIQPTSAPAEEHLLVLLLLADACRRAGAERLTAVLPYFGYARQDRRAQGRQPIAARLVADLLVTAGFHRVVGVDLHNRASEGMFSVPLEHLTALPLLTERVRGRVPEKSVVVASDLGATKLAERWSQALGLPSAFVHKQRLSPERVAVRDVTGDVAGLAPLLVDDMISTGSTLVAAIEVLLKAGARNEVTVAVTHGLLVGGAAARLGALGLARVVVTDSVVAPPEAAGLPTEVVSLAPLLASAIRRLYEGQSLADLLSWG